MVGSTAAQPNSCIADQIVGEGVMADLVSFDFTLDNILSVKAPRGTKPEDLHGELRDKLAELLATQSECFMFEGIYEDD
tara:strand:+ start:162 stop:398 length:237 start_codon:yes stop_codon:yes gene_type:complete